MPDRAAISLRGKRVVVTRAAEQSEKLLQELRAQGAEPALLPLVGFEPPDDLSALDRALSEAQSYDWLMLTSQNAVRALQERCAVRQRSFAELLKGVSIAAVGPATAETVRNAGLRVDYVAEKHQGSALAEELACELKGKKVLLPRSDRANPELVTVLQRIGADVTSVVAYKTIRPAVQDLQNIEAILDRADAVLFFSPSAAHRLQEILGSEKFREFSRRAVFAAIGPVTGDALRHAQVTHFVQAQDSTVAAALDALANYFATDAAQASSGVQPG